MAASRSDMYFLGQDATFKNRVLASLTAACVAIANEGWTIPFHRERAQFASQVLNQPSQYYPLFAATVATDSNVISDATQAGTVALTAGNTPTQGALVTDIHIDNAVSGQFNSFFRVPGV